MDLVECAPKGYFKDNDTIEIVSELIEGEAIFDSRGYSKIKLTRLIDGAPTVTPINLPIKSTGVAEYQAELNAKAPVPPVTKEFVKKNSPEGKALGLPHDRIVQMYDTTDQAYVDKLDEFQRDLNWRVAIFALDMTLKLANGTVAEAYEDKKKVLQTSGITGFHINKILRDVNDLTLWAEDRQDFLSGEQ